MCLDSRRPWTPGVPESLGFPESFDFPEYLDSRRPWSTGVPGVPVSVDPWIPGVPGFPESLDSLDAWNPVGVVWGESGWYCLGCVGESWHLPIQYYFSCFFFIFQFNNPSYTNISHASKLTARNLLRIRLILRIRLKQLTMDSISR